METFSFVTPTRCGRCRVFIQVADASLLRGARLVGRSYREKRKGRQHVELPRRPSSRRLGFPFRGLGEAVTRP